MDRIKDENYCDEVVKNDHELYQGEDEVDVLAGDLNYTDLAVLGKLWIQALRTVLVGADFSIIPVVYAAKPPEPPKRPPKMKYKDLPIYESPHYDYKDYIESKDKCPDRNVKLLQKALLPHVQNLRKMSSNALCTVCCTMRCTTGDVRKYIRDSKNDFKKSMRDPNNLQIRQGVVAGGTLAGFLLGGGGGIPRRVFFTSLGALATGALCFPKETDEHFRNVAYHTAKCAIAFFNILCRKDCALRERLPCKDDLPPEPKPRKPVCQKK